MNPGLRAQRRRQILDAAREVFSDCGYADADLDVVALRVGVAKGTIYRYFRSKEALFLATVDDGMQRLLAEIAAAQSPADDPLDALASAVGVYLHFFDKHPSYVELFIQERAQFRDRRKSTYFTYRQRHIQPWRQLVRGLIAAQRVRRVPVDRVLNVLGDLLYGTLFANYFAARKPPVEQQVDDVLDVVFFGMLTETEARRRRPARRARQHTTSRNGR